MMELIDPLISPVKGKLWDGIATRRRLKRVESNIAFFGSEHWPRQVRRVILVMEARICIVWRLGAFGGLASEQ